MHIIHLFAKNSGKPFAQTTNYRSLQLKIVSKLFYSSKKNELNYYEILGISNKATPSEIKQAYISLVKKFHPDALSNSDESSIDQEKSKNHFLKIQEAFSVLNQPNLRFQYDRALDSRSQVNNMNNSNHRTRPFTNIEEEIWQRQFEEFERIHRSYEKRGQFSSKNRMNEKKQPVKLTLLILAVMLGAFALHFPRYIYLRQDIIRRENQQRLLYEEWKPK